MSIASMAAKNRVVAGGLVAFVGATYTYAMWRMKSTTCIFLRAYILGDGEVESKREKEKNRKEKEEEEELWEEDWFYMHPY